VQPAAHPGRRGTDLRLFAALFAPLALVGATLVALRESTR
jgi:hypothetical protein